MEKFRFNLQRFADTVLTEGDDYYANYTNDVRILALGGNDTIKNREFNADYVVDNVTIQGGTGDDSIYNSGRYSLVDAGDGDDTISNWSGDHSHVEGATIRGGAGNNYIGNAGDRAIITAGEGNDTIENWSSNTTIDGGDGDNYIHNWREDWGSEHVLITTGTGNDFIGNSGDNAIINAGEGDNTISSSGGYYDDEGNYVKVGNKSTINSGAGNDSISSSGDNVSINAGDGDNTIHSGGGYYDDEGNYVKVGNKSTINSGAGNDSISSEGDSVSINAGDGDNTISSSGDKATIISGKGNDSIYNYGKNVSIDAGDGNDSINSYGESVTIDAGDGDNYIENWGDNVTINSGAGDDSINNRGGSNVTIDAGEGNDFINNEGNDNVSINAGGGNDSINSSGDKSTIISGVGNDSIYNYGESVTIDAGDGDNYIENRGDNVTINSGDGDDYIENRGENASIDSGDGDDYITTVSHNVTISGDTGNDFIKREWGIGTAYVYTGGRDTLEGFDEFSALVIADAWTSQRSDDSTVIINVSGKGTITLTNYWAENVNIVSSLAEVKHYTIIENYDINQRVQGTEGHDYIINEGNKATINGGAGDDKIENNSSKVLINGGAGNDYIEGGDNSTISGGAGDDTIHAGWNDYNLITYTAGDGNDIINGFDETSTLSIGGDGLYTSQVSGNNVMIYVGTGSIILQDAAGLNTLNIIGTYDTTPTALNLVNYDSDTIINGTDLNDTVNNDGGNNVMIIGDGGNDSIITSGHNVTVSGGTGDDYVQREWGVGTAYVYTGGNDTLKGFDDNDATALVIADAWTSQRSNDSTVVINVDGKGTITLIDCWEDNLKIVSSLADVKHYNLHWNDDSNTTFTGTSGDDYLWNGGNKVKVNALGGEDYIDNDGSNSTVDAGAGNDFVGNWDGTNNLIRLGDGNDIFQSNTGNYTVDGGQGDDTIRSWEDGASDISINGGTGDDFFDNNSNHVTINAGEGNDFIGNWGSNAHHVSINAGDGHDTIENNAENVTIDAGAGNDYYASGSSYVKITGGAGKDEIYSWYSATHVSMDGGDDDDHLHNDSPFSTVTGGAGDDTINNYAENSFVDGGKGNDYIHMNEHMDWNEETQTWDYVSSPDNVTINGGDGNDTIINSIYGYRAGANVSINGGAGNDYIVNDGFNATITGGKGDDTVRNEEAGMVYVYKSGDGNDFLEGLGVFDTLVIDGASYTTVNSGDNLLVKVGSSTITIRGAANSQVNIASSLKDIKPVNVITNEEEGVSVNGTDNPNRIRNFADNVTINGGKNIDVINNEGENVTINGGAGNDSIENAGFNVSIAGGKGDDTVRSYEAGFVYVYKSGDGNDFIEGFGVLDTLVIDGASYTTVNSGDDLLVKVGSSTITVGGAANSQIHITSSLKDIKPVNVIRNEEEGVSVNGTDNPNWIRNFADNVTINGGKSSDDIYNDGANVIINGGDERDQIRSYNSNVTMNAGAGNDIVYNGGENVSVDGGAGDDLLRLDGVNVTASGGAGNDLIRNFGDGLVYVYSNGDDTIEAFGEYDALVINDSYTIERDEAGGSAVVSVSGKGTITLKDCSTDNIHVVKSAADVPKITRVVIDNSEPKIYLGGSDGPDRINNWDRGQYATIDGGAGPDKIQNLADDVIIIGGAGNDSIVNVDDGDGNEDGSFGDGRNVTFVYNSGDGNDTIQGFNSTSTLDLGGATYTSKTSGDDITIGVGTGSILLRGAATLDALNIIGEYDDTDPHNISNAEDKTVLTGTNDADTIKNTGANVTINALGGKDEIYNGYYDAEEGYVIGGHNVTINGGEGNDRITNIGDSVTIDGGEGNDRITNIGENVTFVYTSGDGNDTVYGFNATSTLDLGGATYSSKTSGEDVTITVGTGSILLLGAATLDNLNIIGEKAVATWTLNGTTATFGDLITLSGVKSLDGISLSGNVVTVGKNSLNGKPVELTGDGYTLALAEDVPTSAAETPGAFTNFANGTATFTTNASGEFYTLNGNKISYTAATAGKSITIKGLSKNLTLNGGELSGITVETSNGVTTFKIREDALTEGDVTITGDNCKLALDGYTAPAEVPATFANGVYTQAHTPAHYTATDQKISYVKASDGGSFTITGLSDAADLDNGITVEGKTVTLSAAALNGENVTITKGYTLKIAGDVPTSSKKVAATWTSDGDEHTYTAAGTPAYYKLSSNKLTFTPAKGGETFTLTGIADTKGVKVSGTKVTVGKAALGDSDITLTTEDGFKLALDKSVTAAKEIKAGWKKSTYTAAGTTAGYVLDGDTISYSEPVGGEQFTISGLKNTSDVTVEDYVVTIGAGSLNGKKVTFSGDDFTVELADDVPTEATEVEGGFTSVTKGTATYRTAHVSEAYTLGDGTITYTAAVGGQDVKITNLDKTAELDDMEGSIEVVESDDGLQITFMDAAVLTTKAPTISAPKGVAYTVAVDEALSTAEETLQWKSKSTAATLSADTGATYTVAKNKVVYTKAKSGTAQAVLTGLANTNLATPEDNVITLDAENLGTKTSLKSNAGGYSIELTGDMSGKTFVGSTGADTIDIAATGALVDGGKGNDEFNISGSDVTILSSAGNDTTNFADGLTVSLSGTTTVKELEQTDSGVQLTFSNKATLTVAEVTDTFEVVGKKQTFTVDTDKFALADSLTFSGKSVTVAADFTGALTPDDDIYLGGKLSTVTTIDASAVTEGISIDGNAKANVIYGGGGDDTLWGGAGNDTLIGGDGSDTFIFGGEGKDVVRGFSDDDLLEIVGNFTTSVNKTGTEIALKVGKGSLTLKDFTATDFNINGETYSISGNKLAK